MSYRNLIIDGKVQTNGKIPQVNMDKHVNVTDHVFELKSYTSLSTGLTASTTQTQAGALVLADKDYHFVSTVANSGDAVKLPAAAPQKKLTIKNGGANPLQVFPESADTINGGSANASITIQPRDVVTFVSQDTTNWETDSELGTTGTVGLRITESSISSDNKHYITTLTLDEVVFGAIAGGADLGLGVLAYTLPAGALVVNAAYMSVALDESDGNITADTPDIGIGTTVASGAVAVLGGTAAFENILTGQTAADCDGTATVKTVADQPLAIEAADNHTVYLNIADGWAASGEAALKASGTIVLEWTKLV